MHVHANLMLASLPEQKLFAEEIVLKEVDDPSETNDGISLISTCCQSSTTYIFARQSKASVQEDGAGKHSKT